MKFLLVVFFPLLTLIDGSLISLKRSPLKLPQRPSLNSFNSIRGGETIIQRENRKKQPSSSSSSSIATSLIKSSPLLAAFKDNWLKIPPFSRLFLSSSFLLTFFSFYFNHNRWPNSLMLNWNSIRQFQLWRLFTCFLYFGSFGLNYLLTMHFVWQYLSQIEKLYFDRPEKFVVLFGFGTVSLLTTYFLFNLSTSFLGHNLLAYIVYIWSRIFEGTPINLMGLATFPAEVLPWLYCLQSVLIDGYFPWTDLLGILAGHCYLVSEKNGWLKSPSFLVKLMNRPFIKKSYEKYGSDFE